MRTVVAVLLLALTACSGEPTSALFTAQDPLSLPDAGEARAAPTSPLDASTHAEGSIPPSTQPDAGGSKGEPDAQEDVPRLQVAMPDAGVDVMPVSTAACVASACSAYTGTCTELEASCGGALVPYVCGSCPVGNVPTACGDNGTSACGNACRSVATNGSSNDYFEACVQANAPTVWVVPGNCTGTPWVSAAGGPLFRPSGILGCTIVAVAISGEPSNAVCCP